MKVLDIRSSESAKEFNKLMKKQPVVVLFYMDGCFHCDAMKPAWNEMENRMIRREMRCPMALAKVNSDYLSQVDTPRSVYGFPTIMHLKDGDFVEEHEGPRDLESLTKFVESVEERNSMSGGKRKTRKERNMKRKSIKKARKHKKSMKASTKSIRKMKKHVKHQRKNKKSHRK